ncbi:unnamed protein product [Mycena citricolor]|uniref:RING-type domain-containing protein n=1 Tax=Mycena citricolor TaxID=2018698 RepID=A0AAD2HD78_9AGAR|nr:unnamed protein product [Mycena citricolor]
MDPVVGNESPQPRTTTTIFNSFLGRGRPRNHSQSHNAAADLGLTLNTNTINNAARELPVTSLADPDIRGDPAPPGTTHNGRQRHMLRRRRSASNVQPQPPAQVQTPGQGGPPAVPPAASQAQARTAPIPSATLSSPHPATGASAAAAAGSPSGTGHRLRLVPHIDSRRSLRFDPITRELRGSDPALRIGGFTDRLSPANTDSRPHQIKDGDILQLGVDYQGGAEDIYKSVKIRIEVGREWQTQANAQNLRSLGVTSDTEASSKAATSGKSGPPPVASGIPDCCICLFPVRLHQAVFLAPCSHAFHYKCMRPMRTRTIPLSSESFECSIGLSLIPNSCPLCRTFADLNEEWRSITRKRCDEEFEDPGSFPAEAAKDTVTETSTRLLRLRPKRRCTRASCTPLSDRLARWEIVGDAEGVLADDLEEAEEGDEVEEMFTGARG